MTNYIEQFKSLIKEIYVGPDLKRAEKFLNERNFISLFELVKGDHIKYSKQEVISTEEEEIFTNLSMLRDSLEDYLYILGEDVSTDDDVVEEESEFS